MAGVSRELLFWLYFLFNGGDKSWNGIDDANGKDADRNVIDDNAHHKDSNDKGDKGNFAFIKFFKAMVFNITDHQ